MAATTGLPQSSILKSSGSSPAPRGFPAAILTSSLMSAPAIKVLPPPIRTAALSPSSFSSWSMNSEIPSGTPGLKAFTGGLLMVMTPMFPDFANVTRSPMTASRLVDLQLISPNVCYPVYPGGQDGTTSETPASYAKGATDTAVQAQGFDSFCSCPPAISHHRPSAARIQFA